MLDFDGTQFVNGLEPDAGTNVVALVIARIERYAQHLLDQFVGSLNYSAAEMASWPILAAEAKAYAISGSTADCPMCLAEAEAAGIPLSTLLSRVSANASGYSSYLAAVKGARTKNKLAVAAMTNEEALAYDWRVYWP